MKAGAPAHVSVSMFAWCPEKPEEDIGYPETGLTNSCELPCGYWKLNSRPFQEQQVLLMIESSYDTQKLSFKFMIFNLE